MTSLSLPQIVHQDGDQQASLLCNISDVFNLPCTRSQTNASTIVGTHAFQIIWEGSITNIEVSSITKEKSK